MHQALVTAAALGQTRRRRAVERRRVSRRPATHTVPSAFSSTTQSLVNMMCSPVRHIYSALSDVGLRRVADDVPHHTGLDMNVDDALLQQFDLLFRVRIFVVR